MPEAVLNPEDRAASVDEALEFCIVRAEGEGIELGAVLDRLGAANYCFLCLLMSIPFIQPMSLGPYTMASGLVFILAGWQMARGHPKPRLPARALRWHLHGKAGVTLLRVCKSILGICRRFTRVRLTHLVDGPRGVKLTGSLVLIGGALLAIPFLNLPFNNTLPALMVLCAVIAWLERDGLFVFVSIAWGFLTLVYFAVVGILSWKLLVAAWHAAKEAFFWVVRWFGAG